MESRTLSAHIPLLRDWVRILVRRWYVSLLATILTLGMIFGVAYERAHTYTASVRLVELSGFTSQVYGTADPAPIIERIISVIKGPQVAHEVFNRVEEATARGYGKPSRLVALVRVNSAAISTMIEIEARDEDARFAEVLADTYADVAAKHLGGVYEQSFAQTLQSLDQRTHMARQAYDAAQTEYESILASVRLSEIGRELEYVEKHIDAIQQLRMDTFARVILEIEQAERLRASATSILTQLDNAQGDELPRVCFHMRDLLSRTSDLVRGPGLSGEGGAGPDSVEPTSDRGASPGAVPAEVAEHLCGSRDTMKAALSGIIAQLETHRNGLLVSLQSGREALAEGQGWPIVALTGSSASAATAGGVEEEIGLLQAHLEERARSLEQSLEHGQGLLTSAELERNTALRSYSDLAVQYGTLTQRAAAGASGLRRTDVTTYRASEIPLALFSVIGLAGGMILGSIAALSLEYGARYRTLVNRQSSGESP